MANITITTPQGRYFIEVDSDGNGIYKLSPMGQRGPMQLFRDNERDVVAALFLSDTDSRTHEEVAAELSVPSAAIRQWRHELQKKNRKMGDDKYEALKKVYGIDAILKRK